MVSSGSKFIMIAALLIGCSLRFDGVVATGVTAPRQMELLGRGIVAVSQGDGKVFISWRMLGTDPAAIAFNLYRAANGGKPVKLNEKPIADVTSFVDAKADLTKTNSYFVRPVLKGKEQVASKPFSLPANAPGRQYLSIPLQTPTGYAPNDASAGDLDGDRKKMIDQYTKLKADYKTALEKANEQAVSAEEREKRKKSSEVKLAEMNDLESSITQFDRQARTSLDEQQRRMRDNILSEIRGVVELKAKAGGYAMVLDTAGETANRTPFVLYTNNESDITKAVLAQLNETAPANRVTTGSDKDKDKEKK